MRTRKSMEPERRSTRQLLVPSWLNKPELDRLGRRHGPRDLYQRSASLFAPVQPAAAASFISLMVTTFLVFPTKIPKKLSSVPVGLAARIRISPEGIMSKDIRSPGLTPKCFKRSRLRVIWPLAVTVCDDIVCLRVGRSDNVR